VRDVGGKARRGLALAACAAVLPLVACGGSDKQDADEASGDFTVDVVRAQFPRQQRLAETAQMVITVRNVGDEKVPLVGVTLTSGGGVSSSGNGTEGSGAESFGYRTPQPGVADSLRPIWVLDKGPGQVQPEGPGGSVTAYVGTWTLGPLEPRQQKTFTWSVVPSRAGNYRIDWRVEAGLDGKAKARLSDGSIPRGAFPVFISGAPSQQRVTDSGEVVAAPENE
jgi:hypothetical protein